MIKIPRVLILITCLSITQPFVQATSDEKPLDGYSNKSGQAEREWEAKFRSLPSPANAKEYMRRLTARPHHVGSPYDKDNAEWLLAKFKEWGFDAHIENFDVLFPTPKDEKLEMVEPRKFSARLSEPPVSIDPTSSQTSEQLPAYNAYSIDGDVTAPLVFVNYGMPADYEELARYGISVKGAIVIARYGHGWRGTKPKVAAEHGALGCIIYSDPRDDGYTEGDVYPQGGWRPPAGIQRGSVMDTDYPGDPLTPGIASVPGAKRLSLAETPTITKIPVLPISYADAQPLLAELQGRVAPSGWRGGMPLTYHLGPGPAKVHLRVQSNWDQKKLYDVIAKIPGSEFPDEWILRGNHHDAWVNGAEDPISGLVAELEEARAFGELVKKGWKPKRTIVYCAWDGEEPGLLGSTEWVEAHSDELLQHAVAYFNSDTNGRGYLYVDGAHVLEKFINSVARDVPDPEKDMSIWQRRKLDNIAHAASPEDREEARNRSDWRIGALGDGSDYTAFMHHLGIPSADIGFGGEGGGGVYHSIYDDFYWFTHFGDPTFVYSRAESQLIGTAVMRLAGAELLPFDFAGFADTVKRYLSDVQKLLKTDQDDLRERNRELEEGVFNATSDPTKPMLAPPKLDPPPHFNFAPLENAIDALTASADRFSKAVAKMQSSETPLAASTIQQVNRLLMQSGPALTDPAGLPHRPWFKNQIYAPGAYTGYESKPLPGVLEALDRKNWQEAESQIPREAEALQRETKIIDQATAALQGAVTALGYQYFTLGDRAHSLAPTQAGVALMGGGTDQDVAFQWMCDRAGTGGLVVLRASGTDAYNPYIKNLCPALDSVETFVITSREGAHQQFVGDQIRKAQAVFIAGGSQDNYVNFWKGTPVQYAINSAISRGVPIGGTSAGLAVLGQYAFSALHDTIRSDEALLNPFDERVTLDRDFIRIPHLEGKITDSHFVARDRMGRLVVFLARISNNGWTRAPYGIGIDEKTALLMAPDGSSNITGQGAAYFLHAPGLPEECRPNSPLTYQNISVYRLSAGMGRFNISSWTGEGGTPYSLSAKQGVLTSSLPDGQIY